MSTTGILGHDGCHFSYEGYKEFANRILPLVSRDFYGENPSSIITPPQLLSSYSNSILIFWSKVNVISFLPL